MWWRSHAIAGIKALRGLGENGFMGSYAKGIKVWRAEEADGDGGVDDVAGLER